MYKTNPLSVAAVLRFVLVGFSVAGHAAMAAETPVNSDVIRLGMSTVLSGPAENLGTEMRSGVLAALQETNQAGGIQGKQLELIALDDGYEPSRTAPNMRQLIDKEQVVAIVGNVGTPTAIAAIPIANESRTPFFGAYTGAGVLRKSPPDRYVINYRASYAEETAAMVDALIDHAGLAPEEIAFFTQRDGYGDAGFAGGVAALKRRGLTDENAVSHGRYERNTLAVENGLADVMLHDPLPRAVIMVGAYAPCAKFIQLARQIEYESLFLNVSFVGTESLAAALGSDGDGVVITQVVPDFESDLPIANNYRQALERHHPGAKPTYGSFEGYVAGRIICQALSAIEGPITREAIVDALEGLGEFDPGFNERLELSPTEHQASHRVWPTVLHSGRIIPFEWSEIDASGKW